MNNFGAWPNENQAETRHFPRRPNYLVKEAELTFHVRALHTLNIAMLEYRLHLYFFILYGGFFFSKNVSRGTKKKPSHKKIQAESVLYPYCD